MDHEQRHEIAQNGQRSCKTPAKQKAEEDDRAKEKEQKKRAFLTPERIAIFKRNSSRRNIALGSRLIREVRK